MSGGMQGRWALITGGGGEIGRETALTLAQAGVNVVAADIAAGHAEETAVLVRAHGVQAESLRLDVTDFDAVTSALPALAARTGGLDYVVNLAGNFTWGTAEQITPQVLHSLFSVNVYGTAYVCRAALPLLRERGGAIVNTSSVHGQSAQLNTSAYSAAKGAIIAYTRSLSREAGPMGVRANVVAPGPINTAEWRGGDEGERLQQRIVERSKRIPLGRIGTAEEVARAIVFLLSPAAAFVTGQALAIGGGEVTA